ncbi:MAG: hypothetical protein LBH30_01520 [Prevotellaceae bacterium]|jgi:hypothetical protein|nr:hypothetical protein [Prevotellaceae bacterium]
MASKTCIAFRTGADLFGFLQSCRIYCICNSLITLNYTTIFYIFVRFYAAMIDNKINKVLIFTSLVVTGTLLLSLIPAFNIDGFEMKKADVLADIRNNKTIVDTVEQDTVVPIIPKFIDTCKTGIICINDYSAEQNALSHFYDALEANNRQIRIAYFGDSFIEGDLLTGSLRNLFQQKYGGKGVGFVPVNCITAGFRTTVLTSASGWEEHCLTDSIFSRSKQGISGHYFIPYENATATFSCRINSGKVVDTCSTASFYFITDGNLKFTTTVNRKLTQQHTVEGSSNIQKVTVNGQIGHIRITVNNVGVNTRFFGVTLDNENTGIVVDNYALRGVSGENIKSIPEKTLKDFDKLRSYDLIILQYGLNVATKTQTKYDYYQKAMTGVIKHLRNNLPHSDIMLISVGDRAAKINGEMITMPGIKSLLVTQQKIASECGIAFWNLIEAMELDGGMMGYVKSKPPKANSDYTHINIRGGEQVAKHLFEAFEYAKEKYIEKKKYNKLKQ